MDPTDLYRVADQDGVVLYIGIAYDWPSRFKQHAAEKPWWKDEVRRIDIEPHPSREEALAAEEVAIRAERPRYNVQHARALPELVLESVEDCPTTCDIEGCGSAIFARLLCRTHYTRWRKHGDPSLVLPRGRRRGDGRRSWKDA
jgi:predicted GIY-YIG superfamily endonuclease